MSWVVFLGGSESHRPFVEAARQQYRIVMFDVDAAAPCRELADEFQAVSCHDYWEMSSHCEMLDGIAGVMSHCSAVQAIKARAELAEDFGLPCYSPLVAKVVYNKAKWKAKLSKEVDELGIGWMATPEFCKLDGNDLGYSWHGQSLMKPIHGFGGDGVVPGFFACNWEYPGWMLESFVDGAEYSINGYRRGGDIGLLAILRKFSFREYLSVAWEERFQRVAQRVLYWLGINHSFFAVDVIDDGEKLWVIDVGLLLDSGVDVLLTRYGRAPYELAVQLATGAELQPWGTLEAGCS